MKLLKAFVKLALACGVGAVLSVSAWALGNYLFARQVSEYAYLPAHGTVVYEDGSPLEHGEIRLTFYPLDVPAKANLSPRAGIAVPNKEGTFESVTSLQAGDGLLRARYRITLTTFAGQPLAASVVPRQYASFDTSPLEVSVETMPLLLKLPRPSPKRRK